MKEFRVARCLVDKTYIKEFAIFSDGSRRKVIQTNDTYGKYFEVDNELNDDEKTMLRRSFTGRIKDALDTIKNGNGDCIGVYDLFGVHTTVTYFLDRTIGEELRQKTLEGWKDTKFGWCIECGNKNSFSGPMPINPEGQKVGWIGNNNGIMIFDERNDAEEYAKGMVMKSAYYAKRLASKIAGVEDEEERDKIIDDCINEMIACDISCQNVIFDFTFDMLTDTIELKSDECKLDNMMYRVVQCIHP